MPQTNTKHSLSAGVFILLSAGFHLWYSTQVQLVQDESYYWQWSRHLAVGYYDNTPLMAFVIRLGTLLLGDTEIGVRCGAVFCSSIALVFVYVLATEMFGSAVGLIAVIVTGINPLFGAGSFLMTQDPVQICFWTVTAWLAWRATSTPSGNWMMWLLCGVCAGLTTMSKLNGLLILPSLLLYLSITPQARHWLTKPQPYVAVFITLAIFSPFVWWNHTHGNAFWIHIHSMGSRTDSHAGQFTVKYLGDFLGAQAGLLSPLLFLTFLWTLIRAGGVQVASAAERFCWSLSVVVFVVTILVSFRSRVEGNWAVASYITGLILVANVIVTSWNSQKNRVWHGLSLGLAAVMTIALFASTLLPNMVRLTFLEKRTNELYGWRELAGRIQKERLAMADNPFVFGVNYRMPSEVAFYLPDHPNTYSLSLHDRANQYMFWEKQSELIGRDAIFINDDDQPSHLSDCQGVFRRVEVQPVFTAYRQPNNTLIRKVQIFRCYGYKGYRREDWQVGW